MTTEEKILDILEKQGKTLEQQGKTLENLQAGQERIEKAQQQQGLAIGRITTVLKVLEAGQNDIREHITTKADVQDIKAEQGKLKRRIENVEEQPKPLTRTKINESTDISRGFLSAFIILISAS